MGKIIPHTSKENPKEYMVAAPVDVLMKNRVRALADMNYDGIEARVVRKAIETYLEGCDLKLLDTHNVRAT